METGAVTGFLEEVNRQIDPTLMLKRIGYATDRIQAVGDSIKAFCPIHKDARYRTLLIDQKRGTFKCTIKTCAGYSGGTLVDLFALARQVDRISAANELVGALDLQVDTSAFVSLSQNLLGQAESAFVAGDHEAAEQAARQALEFKPDCAEARLLLANIHIARGESSQASDEFIAVAEKYLAANQFEEADEMLAAAARMLSGNEDLVFMQVRSAELRGKKEEAIRLLNEIADLRDSTGRSTDNVGIYEKLLEIQGDNPALRVKLGDVCEMRRDIKRACKEWEQAADALLGADSTAGAIQLYERVLKFEPHMNRLRMRLADALLKEGELTAARQHIFEVVNRQLEQSDFSAAAQSTKRWLEVEPESVDAHEALARIYQEQMMPTEAAVELRAAAGLLHARGDEDKALEYLFRVKFLTPDDVDLRHELIERLLATDHPDRAAFEMLDVAEVLFGRGDTAEAEKSLKDAADICRAPELQVQIAEALRLHSRTEAAIAAYRRAATIEGQNPKAALKCLDHLLALAPEDATASAQRAVLLLHPPFGGKKHQADAAASVKKLAQRGENESVRVVVAAAAALENIEAKHLISMMEAALDVSEPESTLLLYPKVAAQLRAGDKRKLLDLARRAVAILPEAEEPLSDLALFAIAEGAEWEAADANRRLADICEARGDRVSLLKYVEAALAIDAENPDLLRRRAELLAELKDPKLAQRARLQYVKSLRKSGDLARSITEYEKYIQDYADDSESRSELVDLLAAASQPERACEHLKVMLAAAEKSKSTDAALVIRERLIQIDPSDLVQKQRLAQAYAKAGHTARAVDLYVQVSRELQGANDVDGAIAAARAAHKLVPDDGDILELCARAEAMAGDTPGLDECLKKLVTINRLELPVQVLRRRTAASLELRNFKEAEASAEYWAELAPGDPLPLEQLSLAYRGANRTQRAVEVQLQLSAIYAQSGNVDGAIGALNSAIEMDPEGIEPRQQLWQLLLDSGRQEPALVEMQQLADLHIERRAYKEASALLSRILEFQTSSSDTLRRLASLVCEHEGFDKALPYYRKLLALRGESGDAVGVIREYESILRVEGATVDLRIEFADYLESAGELASAKEQLLQIAQTFRDELSDTSRAIFFFERAAAILREPSDARIYEELATLHVLEEMPGEAADALREAIRLYEADNNPAKVADALEQLVELPGAQVQDFVKLASRLADTGKRKEAIAIYRRALALPVLESSRGLEERRKVSESLVQLDPLDDSAASALIKCLSPGELTTRAGELLKPFIDAGMSSQQRHLLLLAREAAPEDPGIRRMVADYWRRAALKDDLRKELLELCTVLCLRDQSADAEEYFAEIETLTETPDHEYEFGQVLESCGKLDRAVKLLLQAAQGFAEAANPKAAVSALKEALAIDASAVPASQIAALVRGNRKIKQVRELATGYYVTALQARSRTRALVTGTAILESGSDAENRALLERTFEIAGDAFLVAVAGAHADGLLEAGDKKRALGIAEATAAIAPTSPDAWWLIAQFRRKTGKETAAEASIKAAQLFAEAGAVTEEETCYREALDETPDDVAVLETLAFFYERERRDGDAIEVVQRLIGLYLAAGDHAKTVQWLRRGIDLAPDNRALREQMIENLIAAGNPDQAAEHLAELARLYSAADEHQKAILAYERIVQLQGESDNVIAHIVDAAFAADDPERIVRYSHLLADLKAQAGALKQACQVLNALLEKDPDNLQALEKLASLSKRGQDDRNYCMALNALGHRFAKNGRYAEAIAKFEELLKRRPGNVDLLEMLLDCSVAESATKRILKYGEQLLETAEQQHDFTRMRNAAQALVNADAARAPARQKLAEALYNLGDAVEAQHEWSAAADQFQSHKEYQSAAECLKRIAELDRDNLPVLKRYADVLVLHGDSDGARESYFRLAAAYVASGELNSAEAVMERLLQIDPDDAQTHKKALALFKEAGRTDAAIREILWLARRNIETRNYTAADLLLQEGLELDADNLEFQEMRIEVSRRLARTDEVQFRLRELGQRFVRQGDLPRAIQTFEELKTTAPDALDVRRELATLYAKLGRTQESGAEYAHVVRALLQRKDNEEARETAERALSLRPGDITLTADLAEAFASAEMQDLASRYYANCATYAADTKDNENQIKYLTLATDCRPRWTDGLRKLADAYVVQDEKQAASEVMQKLEAVLIEQKQFIDAIDVLRRHVSIAPREVEPRRMLVDVYARTGDRDNRIAELLDLADLLMSLDRIDEVVEIYRDLTRLRPDDISLLQKFTELFAQVGNELEIIGDYLRLAEAQGRRGLLEDSIRTFERVLEIDRRKTETRERFIEFLLKHGMQTRAISEMSALANIYSHAKNQAAALRVLSEASDLQPRTPETVAELARSYNLAGNVQEASRHYARAAGLMAVTSAADSALFYEHALEGDADNLDLRMAYDQQLRLIGDKVKIAANARKMAEIHSARGEMQLAAADYEVASQHDPETLEILATLINEHSHDPSLQYLDYIRYGDRLAALGDVDRAIEAYREARGLDDESPDLIQKYIDAFVQIAPEHEAVGDYLALADRQMEQHNFHAAIEAYKQVLLIDSGNEAAKLGKEAAGTAMKKLEK